MLAALHHWYPQRTFVLLGDGGYATVELACFCARHRQHLVSRLRADAALYAPPPARTKGQKGRTRLKGMKIASPQAAAKCPRAKWKTTTVSWYGGGTRRVRLLTGSGLWYNKGRAVTIRWVYVKDLDGTHRDDCAFSTDTTLSPEMIVGLFTRRWSIEVMFEEVRAHLGFESTRQWSRQSVLRMAPCLLGLFTLVSVVFHKQVSRRKIHPVQSPWYQKNFFTFSDAIYETRRLLWTETLFKISNVAPHIAKLPRPVTRLLYDALARAA